MTASLYMYIQSEKGVRGEDTSRHAGFLATQGGTLHRMTRLCFIVHFKTPKGTDELAGSIFAIFGIVKPNRRYVAIFWWLV